MDENREMTAEKEREVLRRPVKLHDKTLPRGGRGGIGGKPGGLFPRSRDRIASIQSIKAPATSAGTGTSCTHSCTVDSAEISTRTEPNGPRRALGKAPGLHQESRCKGPAA